MNDTKVENAGSVDTRVRIEMKDWLFNAGLVGLYRILRHADKEVRVSDNYIECDASAFDGFEHYFFDYFFETYGKTSLWHRFTQFCKTKVSPGLADDTNEETIKEFIQTFDKDLDGASYRSAYEICTGDKDFIKTKLKFIKDKSVSPSEKLDKIKEIETFFLENRHIILAKYVSYQVIAHYWTGVSFLNKQQVGRNMFDLYKKDFVDPVLPFLNAKKAKSPFGNCLICNRTIHKKGHGNEGLSWLKMDLDSARKTSVYWNHHSDIIVCPVCVLVYTCVPAGFVTFKRKGIFINDNSNTRQLIRMNSAVQERMNDIERMDHLENLTYTHMINLIQQMRESETKQEANNIQIVKFDSNTGYTFNLLSKQVIDVIIHSKKHLETLSTMNDFFLDNKNKINLYQAVIDRIYRNMNLYPLIFILLSYSLRKKRTVGTAGLIFKINMNFIGGRMSDNKIKVMKFKGSNLKLEYKKKKEENKIPGIAYRLLNSLKTKNPNGFMDVIINTHMHIGQEVPTLFVECLDDIECFQAYGYAFLLGFMGDYNPESKPAGSNVIIGGLKNEE
ncbi:MAG: type I-B CRISPR-associated protein Cas8b1/Cst1 [Candidatus Omnitrophota bacterium]